MRSGVENETRRRYGRKYVFMEHRESRLNTGCWGKVECLVNFWIRRLFWRIKCAKARHAQKRGTSEFGNKMLTLKCGRFVWKNDYEVPSGVRTNGLEINSTAPFPILWNQLSYGDQSSQFGTLYRPSRNHSIHSHLFTFPFDSHSSHHVSCLYFLYNLSSLYNSPLIR